MPSRPFHELKAKFDRIGNLKLFGKGRLRDIEITLQRIVNSKPRETTKDLAKRILAVLNGHGRLDDIQHFKLLLRRFEDASGIKAKTLFAFLRRSKAPENKTKHPHEVATLDKNALQYSEFLEKLELLAETIELNEKGKIIKRPASITTVNTELYLRYNSLRMRDELKAKQWIEAHSKPEQLKGTIGIGVVFGTVVVIYDSRKGLPYSISENEERGLYNRATKTYPAFVYVDLNPVKRTDGASPKTTLVHELRHALFDMFKRLMINDPHIPIISATLKVDSPETPSSIRTKKELILKDKQIYSYLLNRELTVDDYENITKQRAYLDELHSSIMQRKGNWFNWGEGVYSKEESKRPHSELVGNNSEDINATKDMFCHLQGFYVLGQIARASKDSSSPWYGKISDRFAQNVSKYFTCAGSLIATALTVQQASRLVAEMWKLFILQHPKTPINHIFKDLPATFVGQPSNGQTLGQFLSK